MQEGSNEKGPRITFEKDAHDFGQVLTGTTTTAEFLFGNAGGSLLRITKIEECCGFSATVPKPEYAPGETGVLKAEYHAGPLPTVMKRQLIVHTNDETQPTVMLAVTAKVIEKVSYEPRGLAFVSGDANTRCPTIKLASLDEKPFSITGFTSTADCLALDYDPSKQATEHALKPTINLEKLQEGMSGSISIRLTHPECDRIAIPFRVLGQFEVTPPQIVIQGAEPGRPVVRKIYVRNNYKQAFDLESTSSQSNLARVVNQRKVDGGYQLDVEVTPPIAGDSKGGFTDALSVSVTGGRRLTVPCRGFYTKQAASPSDLTPEQKAYKNWTENHFALFLDRTEYAGLSDSARRELEQMWIRWLENQSNPQYEAINGLAAIKSEKAVMLLLKIAIDPEQTDDRARWMAVRALGLIGDKSVAPQLIHLIYHYNQNTRLWAQISLARLTGVNFGYDWAQWGRWWNESQGQPSFLSAQIVWTTNDNLADVNNQREKDRQFLEKLGGGSTDSPMVSRPER